MKERPLVQACYDHLGGILGDRLASRLVELGWVTPDPDAGITPLGWTGLTQLGIDLAPLTASRRKPVNFCLDHIGAHLGFLILRHLLSAGWLRQTEGGLELTPEGEEAMRQLGVSLEA